MNDFSTPYLALHKLMKSFYEAINKGNYQQAHEISIDMVDVAQQLEDVSKGLRDAFTN